MASIKNPWRPNKNWMLLSLALALGLAAAYLSNRLLSDHMRELEEEARRGHEMVSVVVAKQPLARGDAIVPDAFAVRQIPRDYVQSDAVTPETFSRFENQRLAVVLQRGDVLLPAHSEGLGGQVFSATLAKGRRALTIEVDTVNALAGMLRPGDHIDLIYSARGADSGDSAERNLPLLANVLVLATDQALSKRDEASGRERGFSTVTLDVTPRDAQRIVLAKQSGRLTAILRHPDDEAGNATGMVAADELLTGAQGGPSRGVEMITGSGGVLADVQLAKLLPALGGAGAKSPGTLAAIGNAQANATSVPPAAPR